MGNKGWKEPMAGYSLREIDFCDCAHGVRYRSDCEAYYQRQRSKESAKAFARAGIPPLYADFTVESWALKAQREAGKQVAASAVSDWLSGDTKGKDGIFLYGSYGTGKTALLTAALSAQMAAGKTGLWLEWFDFVDSVQGKYGAGDGSAQAAVEVAQNVDVLLLDDLGDERKKEETQDRQRLLYQIVNARMNKRLPMLLTTNLTLPEMHTQFGARTLERIRYTCHVIEVSGANWRKDGAR